MHRTSEETNIIIYIYFEIYKHSVQYVITIVKIVYNGLIESRIIFKSLKQTLHYIVIRCRTRCNVQDHEERNPSPGVIRRGPRYLINLTNIHIEFFIMGVVEKVEGLFFLFITHLRFLNYKSMSVDFLKFYKITFFSVFQFVYHENGYPNLG